MAALVFLYAKYDRKPGPLHYNKEAKQTVRIGAYHRPAIHSTYRQ